MALSGYLDSSNYHGRYYHLSWSATQDVASNTSTVYWTIEAKGGKSAWYAERTLKVWVGGLVYEKYNRVERYKGKVASGTVTINHNKEGNANLYLGIDAAVYDAAVNCTGEYTYALNTIARCSQPSCVTWPDTTYNVGNIGSTITIHMNRVSSSFRHYCYVMWGNKKYEIGNGITDNVDWTLPMDMCNKIPSSVTGTGTVYCNTYLNGSYIGQKTVGFSASVPGSVVPSITFTHADDTECFKKYGGYVQGHSKLKVTITGGGSYGSSITGYYNTYDSIRGYEKVNTFDMPTSGQREIWAEVTDSRGRKKSTNTKVTVIPYNKPAVKQVKVYRVNDDGTVNPYGNNFKVEFKASVSPINSKNTATYKIKYKKKTETSYQETVLSAFNNQYDVTGSYSFPADTVSYDVVFEIVDDFNTVSQQMAGTAVKKFFSWFTKGRGFALGKVAEFIDTFEVDWDTRLNKKVYVQNQPLADFVIEQATKDGWSYTLYHSGRLILRRKETKKLDITSTWGNLFYAGGITQINYPFEFNEIPSEIVTVRSDTFAVGIYTEAAGMNSTTATGKYSVFRGTSQSGVNCIFDIYVDGVKKAGEKNAN